MLSETMQENLDSDFLPNYSIATVPATRQGTAGEGLLIAVRHSPHYHVLDVSSTSSIIMIRLRPTDHQSCPVNLAVCYLPPAGSPQLQDHSLLDRIEDIMTAALLEPSFPTILAGDFNAHFQSPLNAHARHLQSACEAHHFQVCTDTAAQPDTAAPTFRAKSRSQATRPDHIIANDYGLIVLEASTVGTQLGSDHLPIEAKLCLHLDTNVPTACQGQQLTSRIWDPQKQAAFAAALQQQPGLLSCIADAQSGDVNAAVDKLHQAIASAADTAGMPAKSRPCHQSAKHRPAYFDEECSNLKRQVRRAAPDQKRQLERKYHSLVRSKARKFHQQRLWKIIDSHSLQDRKFWKVLRSDKARLPMSMQNVQAWTQFISKVADMHLDDSRSIPQDAYPPQCFSDQSYQLLSADVKPDEVSAQLQRLHNGRSQGQLAIPAELFKYAIIPPSADHPNPRHLLLEPLSAILSSMMQPAGVPTSINCSLVTPIFKRGDALQTTNYRPIAVTEPLLRLHGALLNTRLIQATENDNLRADTQAGFRPRHSVDHQLFTLQYLIDLQKARNQPLYVCFFDLKGAYDRVSRPQLWQILHQLGIPPRLLDAICSMYESATVTAKIDGRTGTAIPSLTGVRQGCPLSPTLFGLLADGLHRHLQRAASDENDDTIGIRMPYGQIFTDGSYADDFWFASASPAGLQGLLDATSTWCHSMNMVPSTDKIVCIELTGSDVSKPTWHIDGVSLQTVTSAKLLGLTFETGRGLFPSLRLRYQKTLSAWALLKRQFPRLACTQGIWLMHQLYNACVRPVGMFGCGLWGVYPFRGQALKDRSQINTQYLSHLKRMAHVRTSVSTPILLAELNAMALPDLWLLEAARLYNSLTNSSQFFRDMLKGTVDFASENIGWAAGFQNSLMEVGFEVKLQADVPIDCAALRHRLVTRALAIFEKTAIDPRTAPSDGSRLCTYKRWMWPFLGQKSILSAKIPHAHMQSLFRFRCGGHSLPNIVGARTGIPRQERICPRCKTGPCDERHLVFECSDLASLRHDFQFLFEPAMTMRSFLWQKNLPAVAAFIHKAMKQITTDI